MTKGYLAGPKTKINYEYKYDFQGALEDIIAEVSTYYPEFGAEEEDTIRKAYWFGFDAHSEQRRSSGDPYFMHPVEATKILLAIRPDTETIVACLLHDVIEDTPITAEEIGALFGERIQFLCEGVEKVSQVRIRQNEQNQKFDSIQKLFIAVAKDIRVIFVKLADRIHNLQTLEYVKPEKQFRIAQESVKVYAPIALQLGLYEFKTQIEDCALKYLHPKEYEQIMDDLDNLRDIKQNFIEQGKKELLKLCHKKNIPVSSVSGRLKNVSSIYEKIKRKNLTSVSDMYDLVAFRIIVKTPEQCYQTLGVVHSYWKPMLGRFKDFISVTKPNGYRSLHTTVLGFANSDLPTEIQIRTLTMHMDAEYGPAAHWAYKTNKGSDFDQDYINQTAWLPQDILLSKESKNSEEFFDSLTESILLNRIYVFTPKGEVKNLPHGATPIDFAYSIHSEVGDSAVGARVNGMIKPLDYKLRNGEIIEVLTKAGKQPNPQWLEFAKSSHARARIQAHTNKIYGELTKDSPTQKELPDEKPKKKEKKEVYLPPAEHTKHQISVGGMRDIPHKFGSCCFPTPGKDIIAYKSRGLSVTIHEIHCAEVARLEEPERLIEACYVIEKTFEITAYDRKSLAKDYITVITDLGLHIVTFHSRYTIKDDKRVVTVTFSVETNCDNEITELTKHIEKISGVFSVKQL